MRIDPTSTQKELSAALGSLAPTLESGDADADYDLPGLTLPIALRFDGAVSSQARVDTLYAIHALSIVAGAELFSVVADETAMITVSADAAQPGRDAECTGDVDSGYTVRATDDRFWANHNIGFGPGLWAHELMHALGYYGVDGDVHDDAFMAADAVVFTMSARQQAFLAYLGANLPTTH